MEETGSPFRNLLIVRDEDKCLSGLTVEFGEEFEQVGTGAGIEVSGRFIGQDQGRIVCQGPGDRDPLTFSPGKLGGKMVDPLPQADPFQQLPGPLPEFGAGGMLSPSPYPQGNNHVLPGRELGQKVKELEDKTDTPVPEARSGFAGELKDRPAGKEDTALGRGIEGAEDMEER